MIAVDEDALICDFADTYHIYDYRELPATYAAKLACGLRDDSRIKMKVSGYDVPLDTLLSAYLTDTASWILWSLSGGKGTKKPESIVGKLMNGGKKKTKVFRSIDDFRREWNQIAANAKEIEL